MESKIELSEKQSNIFVFLLIYFSGSTILCGTSTYSVILTRILPDIIMIALLVFWERRLYIRQTSISVFLVVCASLILLMLMNSDFSLNNIYEVVQLLVALLTVSVLDAKEFEKSFVRVMLLICEFSLVVYVVTLLAPSVISIFPTIKNTSGFTYNFLGLSVVQTSYLGHSAIRNFAIFREPGVFVCFISFAYILAKKNDMLTLKNSIIFFLALFSTMSTTGYIIFFIMLLAIILEKKSLNHFIFAIVASALILLILKTQTNLLEADGPIFAKFLVHSSSYNARVGSIEQNIELMKRYPIIGAGWTNSKEFFLSSSLSVHNTNTILYYFSCYGVIVGIVYTLGLIRSFNIKQGVLLSTIYIVILILALSGERICFDISLLALVFYGYDDLRLFRKNDSTSVLDKVEN